MKSQTEQLTDLCYEQYKAGKLGTPEKPLRDNIGHDTFWTVYQGLRTPIYYKETCALPWARAAARAKREESK